MKVAFVGLGVMGNPMALHLAHNGHSDTVNTRPAAHAPAGAAAQGGTAAATPREAAQNADIVMVCVGNDDDASLGDAGENPVAAVDHRATIVVVANAHHDDVGVLCYL
ncbi:MAG: NAD(P)-binding domain-containing protein, partial [Actinomycetota bacterium]